MLNTDEICCGAGTCKTDTRFIKDFRFFHTFKAP